MSVGILMLVHTAFDRAEQVARHWTKYGCPVVIHVDAGVKPRIYKRFVKALGDEPDVRFCKRHRCEWGNWGLVAAAQSAAELMLTEFPKVRHVYLSSGSCLPLRPVQELKGFEKVMLQPGESRTVTFTLRPEDLAFTRQDMSHGWEPGEFRLWIAPSSGAEASTPVTFTLTE